MRKFLLLCALFSATLSAQIVLIAHQVGTVTSSSGGASTTATAGAIDCTGANFLVVGLVSYNIDTSFATILDSTGANTAAWAANRTTNYTHGVAAPNIALAYVPNATVSNSMTFIGVGSWEVIVAACFSNVKISSPLDQVNGADGASGDLQPNSITPTQAKELLISFSSYYGSSGAQAIKTGSGSAMTLIDSVACAGSNGQSAVWGYAVQTTPTATNPAWDGDSPNGVVATVATVVSFFQNSATKVRHSVSNQ